MRTPRTLIKKVEMPSAHPEPQPVWEALVSLTMLYVSMWMVSLWSHLLIHWPEGHCAVSLNSVHNLTHTY